MHCWHAYAYRESSYLGLDPQFQPNFTEILHLCHLPVNVIGATKAGN